jgi:ATP-dependent Lon protease
VGRESHSTAGLELLSTTNQLKMSKSQRITICASKMKVIQSDWRKRRKATEKERMMAHVVHDNLAEEHKEKSKKEFVRLNVCGQYS